MGSVFQRYFYVEGKLGRGAFGQVFKVKSRCDKKVYALKVVDVEQYRITRRDFRAEFDLMIGLKHPNILTIYDSFEDGEDDFVRSYGIQMQYCPKGDLSNYLEKRRGKPLSIETFVTWMGELSSAVEFIHSKKIIHRDLKPENTLLDDEKSLQISDFGIAKAVPNKYTNTCIGTPYFVAPEVLSGRGYDERVDIYSLGKLFICMATVKVIPGEVSSLPSWVGELLTEVIKRSVSSNPAYRPTAKYIRQAVQSTKR